jgi:hypothetical protein
MKMPKFSMAGKCLSLALSVTPWFYPAAALWATWGVLSLAMKDDGNDD